MRLLLISLQKNGAGPRDALEFSNALCELRTTHTIIISSGNELLHRYNSNAYRTVRTLSTYNSLMPSFLLWTLTLVRPLQLAIRILREKPAVIFSTHFHPWLTMLPTLCGLLHAKLYVAAHENPFTDKEGGALSKRIERSQLQTADVIICYSEFIKQQLQGKIFNARFLVLPLGAYHSAIEELKNAHLPRIETSGLPLLVSVGRLEPYKGLHVLIDAYELLHAQEIQVKLLIAGRGELSDELKEKIYELGIILENRWLTASEITNFVIQSDLVVLPYLQASQSGVIPLALAAGKPVVTTNVGGLSEQVDDNQTGRLVTPGNPHALAHAIKELLSNPEKITQMGLKARVLGSTRLSWKRAAEIFLDNL
jgi:glycosyltransferase involved in cell wall biosynthesis